MRYFIFSRVSTDMQDTKNQLYECWKYVDERKKKGDEVIQIDEQALTTRKEFEERPILEAMINQLRKNDIVVMYKTSRIARGHELSMIYHTITKKKKAKFISITEPWLDDELIHAKALIDSYERKNISQQTSTALKRKLADLENTGIPIYGYQLDKETLQIHKERARTFGKPFKLIEKNEEQEQVNLMIELRSRGLSYSQIATELEAKGYKNRKGNPVQKMTVFRILRRLGKQNQAPKAEEDHQFHLAI